MGNKRDKEKDVALENKLTHKHTSLHCADFYRSKATKELIFFSCVLQSFISLVTVI